MANLVDNEQHKLTAAYLNGIAIALIAVGVLAPVAALATGNATVVASVALLMVGCILASAGLHYLAREMLSRLRE